LKNKLLHIGLQVLEEDIKKFYYDILNCELLRIFTLEPENSFLIFKVKEEVKILYTSCSGIELELFITNKPNSPGYGHICIQSSEAEKIAEKSIEKGYQTFIKKRNSNRTYFISDSNHNLFEIKDIPSEKL